MHQCVLRSLATGLKGMTYAFMCLSCLLLAVLAFPAEAPGGSFSVYPMKLYLDMGTKSGIVTVINDGDEDIDMRINAREWAQDDDGDDLYTDTRDLVFFPKIIKLGGKQERIVRVGIKGPSATKEKTYRVFIEEVPSRKPDSGAQVAIAMRFGIPVFSRPSNGESAGEIEDVRVEKGAINLVLNNKGNIHYHIKSVIIKGHDSDGNRVFARELNGWYVLAGARRKYSTSVAEDVCNSLASLDIEVSTYTLRLKKNVDVSGKTCM
jgi:fimbrial chaperone protein